MTDFSKVLRKGTLFFFDRQTAKLIWRNDSAIEYRAQPERYTPITRGEFDAICRKVDIYAAKIERRTNSHPAETIHVFGNGPSLNDFAAHQDWAGKVTIGVNAAGLHIKPLMYWVSVDNLSQFGQRDLYDWIWQWLNDVHGKTATFLRKGCALEIRNVRPNLTVKGAWMPDEMFTHCPADTPA